jgi:uncharacterized protein (DUF2126 family)
MTLNVALTHRTSYRYDRVVALGPQTIRLRPAPHARTPILSYSLTVAPKPHFLNWQQDPQGNFLARVVFPERVSHFEVTVDLVADMATINPFDFFLEPEAEEFPFAYDPLLEHELAPFRKVAPPGPPLAALIAGLPPLSGRTVDLLVALNRVVQSRIAYIVRMEPGVWSPEQTLVEGRGSCRDSAWLLVQMLRHLGFAARFVSGYLIQLTADVALLEGPAGPSSDFADLHAWAEVYLPGAGWIGLDATSGLLTGEGHIPLAATPDPQSAAPVSGAVEKSEATFGFEMNLTRIRETPRTTKPYPEAAWQDILAAGRRVDAALDKGDVRLTMGGEPTLVSATDMDAAEWNSDALGPTKRQLADRLLRRLQPVWAPGAALQIALGKHYPGEQLPRWALHAHWRRDGEPIWRDRALLAPDDATGAATAEDASRFSKALAERLQVAPDFITPAYEDIHYFLWREHRLPANVLTEDAKLKDPLERARLARVFGQGLAAPIGSVLPLRRVGRNGSRSWQSGKWLFRSEALFLIPGDAPIGYRLPLESLPWADPDSIETESERDPFDERPDFPPGGQLGRRERNVGPGATRLIQQIAPLPGEQSADLVRTALAVEPRDGKLHVFFPPLVLAEDWLELAAAVEATAAEFGTSVVLEGYPPPHDPRLNRFSITPDPGVIEVNIHPAASWDEMLARTTDLYAAARETGLTAEKFMLDGRHVGTGGGNHVVMGAVKAADSPFLRRPDLLKSLIGFWHNHPSLSFLFSGLFIGPTSQHPRVDEARQDSLGELELAFRHIAPGSSPPPWLIDRVLRNILADVTGNTHRTEFCIDKLYPPDSASMRLGLVEFRGLEMPPHPEMAMAQMLLMRAAVAAFWQTPYERMLVRWGTRLHDDFMLPHYVAEDFRDSLDELAQLGFKLERDWFEPHFAFRFPVIGAIAARGIQLELRHALEPWHVLGEEPAAGGTVRYVDSSPERLQARVAGWSPERLVLACNGREVPLIATDTEGEYVAGIRFKAWNPPFALHPAVPAQSPLIFDIYDRWNGRSLGGMTHHVSHPGGLAYERFPVNANEAEARRRARFVPHGHTPGPMPPPRPVQSREHPRILDLRRAG